MGIVNIDNYRQHYIINTGKNVHVIPRQLIEDIAKGKISILDLEHGKEILSVILTEWMIEREPI